MRLLTILLIVSLTIGCSKDKQGHIEDSVLPFVNLFFDEANQRGIDIKQSDYNFSVIFDDLDVPGRCNTNNNIVSIDEETWNTVNDFSKEFIVFHELGHCILKREHNNNFYSTGECKSYMHQSALNSEDCSTNIYSKIWRDYYLDELFGLTNELPLWHFGEQSRFKEEEYIYIELDTFISEGLLSKEFSIGEGNYVLDLNFEKTADSQISIFWHGYNISYCFECKEKFILKRTESGPVPIFRYYENTMNSSINFIIKRKSERIYFYLDKTLIHLMEHKESDSKLLQCANTLHPQTFTAKLSIF